MACRLTIFALLLLPAGCDSDPTDPRSAIDLEPFRDLARGADCADLRNRLFLVDDRLVLSDREGSCSDHHFHHTLYGGTPDEVLCDFHEFIGGWSKTCPDERFRTMFETIIANLDHPHLGLGPFHSVEPIPF